MIKDCGGEASNYGKAYETKVPCKLCKEYSEDTINSSIQPKGIGFIPGKEEYHDDECLIWISTPNREGRMICKWCENKRVSEEDLETERLYSENIERTLMLRKNSRATSSGSQEKRMA